MTNFYKREKMLNDNIRRCNHVKTNGIQCGAPAISEHDVCYFHRQAARDFPKRKSAAPVAEPMIDLALIDDPDGIHYALMQVMQGMLNGTLEGKLAGRMLYALQVMSANFKQTSFQRQFEEEFHKSELNCYEIWDKMEKEDQEKAAKQLHEKRVEELKRLERTCCKCRKESDDPASLTPPIPPPEPPKPVTPPPREKQWWERDIKACTEESDERMSGSSDDRKSKALNAEEAEEAKEAKEAKGAKKRPTLASRTWGTGRGRDVHATAAGTAALRRRVSSTLERTCDQDSLPSSDGPTRASQLY
jgi:hypothetical protein